MKENAPGEVMNADSFKRFFEGKSITLMSRFALTQEIALLSAACAPLPEEAHPMYWLSVEERVLVANRLREVLPPEPGPVRAIREALTPLPPSDRWKIRQSTMKAYKHLTHHPTPPPLFLVPSVWPIRMEQVVSGMLFPAQIGFWIQHPVHPNPVMPYPEEQLPPE